MGEKEAGPLSAEHLMWVGGLRFGVIMSGETQSSFWEDKFLGNFRISNRCCSSVQNPALLQSFPAHPDQIELTLLATQES